MQTKGFEPLAHAWKASDLTINRYLPFYNPTVFVEYLKKPLNKSFYPIP
jgi:hypothetical protein